MAAPFELHGEQGDQDELGVVTWMIPYYVESKAAIFTVGEPPMPGLSERRGGRRWRDAEEGLKGAYEVEVTWEGYVGEGDPEDQEHVYNLDPEFREERIETHPLWVEIADFYRGTYDEENKEVSFKEFLDHTSHTGLSSGKGPRKGKGKEAIKNPLFGVETYLELGGLFTESYLKNSYPTGILDRIGTIVKSLPAGFETPADKDWLFMPPSISKRGGVFTVTERLGLSAPGGWPPKVYKLIG